jgi:hypothetical protein
LTGNERSTTCGTTLLTVPAVEQAALRGNPVDVWRLVAHHSVIVTTCVKSTYIIAHDDDDIRLFSRLLRLNSSWQGGKQQGDGRRPWRAHSFRDTQFFRWHFEVL